MPVGPLAPGHRSRVAELLHNTRAFSPAEIDVALELFDAGVCGINTAAGTGSTSVAGDDYRFFGYFGSEGRLLGYACFGPTPATDSTFDLYWIAVDPSVQHAGVGTALMRAVEDAMLAVGAALLLVETSSREQYAATRQFYERRGYAEAARVRGFYAPGDDRIIYMKRFSNSPVERGAVTA